MSHSAPARRVPFWSLLGLAAFLAAEGALLGRFIRVDTRPPSWDQATHLEIALDYREALRAGRWSEVWALAPKPGMPPFPPLYHLLLGRAYDSPDPARAALWLNWWYLAILAVSLFAIARRFLPNGRALAATVAFCAAPAIQDLLTTQLVDLALVAWAAAGYWAFLASEDFTAWLPSLAFGAVVAVGMLHKWSYFSYMIPACWAAARALGDRRARGKVAASAALAAALSAPWYAANLALLPSRLVQASSDFAVPFWRSGAWAVYLVQACGALGPLLWALGFLGLLIPRDERRRDQSWVLWSWVLCSYVFWTLVPNRQIRFLLPGLVPLGVAMAAAWPPFVTWIAAVVQCLGAVNFFFGAVGPIQVPVPGITLPFFQIGPPRREDWKLKPILERVEAARDPSRPIANVTLVANDAFFNGPAFHWMQRWMDAPHARMRGVNRRLCELSEFVLLKKGRLGPPDVIGGLREAADVIAQPGGWFSRGYEPIADWPLPDGSSAVLYRQRRGRRPPTSRRRIEYTFAADALVQARGLHADFGRWDAVASAWSAVKIGAEGIDVRGLRVRGASAELRDFSFIPLFEAPNAAYDWNEIRVMRLDRLEVKSLRLDADDLRRFLEKRVPGLTLDRLTLDGTIQASGRWKGRPVALEAALELDRPARRLRVRVLRAKLLGVPLPSALFRPIKELSVSLDPNPETPFAIDLPGLTIRGGRLTVP